MTETEKPSNLIAEGQEHRPFNAGYHAGRECAVCGMAWPCVTRRLADALEATTAERDARATDARLYNADVVKLVAERNHLEAEITELHNQFAVQESRTRDAFARAEAARPRRDETEWGIRHSQGTNICRSYAEAAERLNEQVKRDETRRFEYRGLARIVTRRKAGEWIVFAPSGEPGETT